MNSPMPSAPARNNPSESSRSGHEPRTGRSNRTIDANTTPSAAMKAIAKYGRLLPMTNDSVPIGAMRICSTVPRSFSRTTDNAVETTAVIIAM
jgi:hypothetical protein